MTLDEKIARLKELFTLRDAIDEELISLLGRDTDATAKGPVHTSEPASARTKKTNAPEPQRRKPGCDTCGAQGWRHKKGCELSGKPGSTSHKETDKQGNAEWQALGDVRSVRQGAMSRHQYQQVKTASKHEIPSDVISREVRVSLKEIQRVLLSKDYEEYTQTA